MSRPKNARERGERLMAQGWHRISSNGSQLWQRDGDITFFSLAAAERANNFKVSDTPPRGPEGNSGHPATAGPPNNKEIA